MHTNMIRTPAIVITIAALIFMFMNGAVSAASKVYSIDGAKLIKWAMKNGYKSQSKKMNSYSICHIEKNILKIRRHSGLDTKNKFRPECLFTLFKNSYLVKGWKVQAILVVSNGLGKWKYGINPKGKTSLHMVIHASYNKAGGATSHNIKVSKVILIGPSKSQSWNEAFLSHR